MKAPAAPCPTREERHASFWSTSTAWRSYARCRWPAWVRTCRQGIGLGWPGQDVGEFSDLRQHLTDGEQPRHDATRGRAAEHRDLWQQSLAPGGVGLDDQAVMGERPARWPAPTHHHTRHRGGVVVSKCADIEQVSLSRVSKPVSVANFSLAKCPSQAASATQDAGRLHGVPQSELRRRARWDARRHTAPSPMRTGEPWCCRWRGHRRRCRRNR